MSLARGVGNFQSVELIHNASLWWQRVKVAFPPGPLYEQCFKISPIKCKNGVLSYIVSQPSLSTYPQLPFITNLPPPHQQRRSLPRHQRSPAEGLAPHICIRASTASKQVSSAQAVSITHTQHGEAREDFMPISHINSSIKMNSCTN